MRRATEFRSSSCGMGLPRLPEPLSNVPCPLPRRIERVRVSIASPLTRPSPNGRRVGIRIVTFEACSGFTHVTARRIAQPPKAPFVTRLQPFRLPGRAARQLPDQSTTLWVESSSTDDSRLRGALPTRDIARLPRERAPRKRGAPRANSQALIGSTRFTGHGASLKLDEKVKKRTHLGHAMPTFRASSSSSAEGAANTVYEIEWSLEIR